MLAAEVAVIRENSAYLWKLSALLLVASGFLMWNLRYSKSFFAKWDQDQRTAALDLDPGSIPDLQRRKNLCFKCKRKTASVIFAPCNHRVLCNRCYLNAQEYNYLQGIRNLRRKCWVCRQEIEHSAVIFLASR